MSNRTSEWFWRTTIPTILALFYGCAIQRPSTFDPFIPQDLDQPVRTGLLKQKVDNFFVLMDVSSSMNDTYTGGGFSAEVSASEFDVEKELLRRLIRTIPAIELNAGFDTFGFNYCLPWNYTGLGVFFGPYSHTLFEATLDNMKCGKYGPSMQMALHASGDALKAASGNIALILISDGEHPSGRSVRAVTALKAKLAPRLCLYTVWVGNTEQRGKGLMEKLPLAVGCGSSFSTKDILSSAGMARFVEKLFFEQSPHADDRTK